MPEHLIFDYFTEPIPSAASASTPQQGPAGPPPSGQRPIPPGQYPAPPGHRPGPPTQPYGGGRGPGGPAGYPPKSGGGGPFGSRRNLVLAIIGAIVLVAVAIGIGFWLSKPKETVTGTPGGQISAPGTEQSPVGSPPVTGAPPETSATASGAPDAPPTGGTGGPSSGESVSPNTLPAGPPLPPTVVVVPMRTDDDDSDTRPLYLVDANEGAKPVKLPGPDGKLSNPLLQPGRTTIAYLDDGVLRVMASNGTNDRDLASREPAGCDHVAGASWSPTDSSVMVISCRLSKNNYRMIVVGTDGQLIRRLDAGKKRFDDLTISPDGQTILYWASGSDTGDGGSLYTLPLIGTGAPKKITDGDQGLDGDPSWSPDGSQIAFRRLVGGADGNADVYVMNADGSGQRVVADTKAADIKPVWSPDGKDLLIVSNRKSAFGSAGKTWDLWLTRVSDGEVLDNFGLRADEITTPTWTYR